MTYQARPGSVAYKALQYFANNPMAELTSAELAKLIGMDGGNIRSYLDPAVRAGMLAFDGKHWLRGNASIQLGGADFPAWLSGKGQESAEGAPTPRPLTLPAPESLKIEDGIEMPAEGPRGVMARYAPVFQRMEPKQCIRVETDIAKRLVKVARSWGKPLKRNFITRPLPDKAGFSGIWRTE
ncbi:hypothetical protein ACFJGW_00705 [Burkholderiaceae bacterium UC74_6]